MTDNSHSVTEYPFPFASILSLYPLTNEKSSIVHIPPYHFAHIERKYGKTVQLHVGPKTHVCSSYEQLILGPKPMISINQEQYCVILNPVVMKNNGTPETDYNGIIKLRHGIEEYRFAQKPFPLYPGESLVGKVRTLPVLPHSTFRLRALIDFIDERKQKRAVGDEWLFEGTGIYKPRKEVEIIGEQTAVNILPNTAILIKAKRKFVDQSGIERRYGEIWLVKTPGSYLPGAYEKIVETRTAFAITDKIALHVKAVISHTDDFNKRRRFWDEWLITSDLTDSYICSAYERVITTVHVTVLDAHQYCIIINPVDSNGVQQIGRKRLVKGPTSFFLKPGESFECGIQDSYILINDDALIVRANESFTEQLSHRDTIVRHPGDQWMIRGPLEYFPPIGIEVIEHRKLIPLNSNEGIYVRNKQTGQIKTIIGHSYMLNHDEVLWQKQLPDDIIELLSNSSDRLGGQADTGTDWFKSQLDLTRVVTYRVPHNAAVQVYDYREDKARVEFGPTLVMLSPDEQFTKLSLSGGKPKQPNMIQTLCLSLGPDFFSDIITAETSDHARLVIKLSYNWVFDVPQPCSQEEAAKLFSVPDFVGDVCRALATRIRGAVAGVAFDVFHKSSAYIIRSSVFGVTADNRVCERFIFPSNNLHITNVDILSVEPVEQYTKDALHKSHQRAIAVTKKSQAAAVRREIESAEQVARCQLKHQCIEDEIKVEEARQMLLESRTHLEYLKSTGKARAEAESRAEASRIEKEAEIMQAKLCAEAARIETEAKLKLIEKVRKSELEYTAEKTKTQLAYRREMDLINGAHLRSIVTSLGRDTLREISTGCGDQEICRLVARGIQSAIGGAKGAKPDNRHTTPRGIVDVVMELAIGRNY